MRTPEAERPTREKGKEIPVEKEWVQKVAKGLDISEFEAFKIIRRNNSLPIVEMVNLPYREEFEDGSNTYFFSSEDTFVYPRLNANTVLLAKASPGFDGPVGPRPTLASQENILSISGLSNIQDENERLKQALGGRLSWFLVESELSASNIVKAPLGVEFSDKDIRRGVVIPPNMSFRIARALGIIVAKATNNSERHHVDMSFPPRDEEFFEFVAKPVFEEAFNIIPNNTKSRRIGFRSKALSTYLSNVLNYQYSHEVEIPPQITTANEATKDEFLKFFLSSCLSVKGNGKAFVHHVSEKLLIQIKDMIEKRVTKPSLTIAHKTNKGIDYPYLIINVIPTMELYLKGFLSENPRIDADLEDACRSRIGKRAKFYLRQTYPNESRIHLA